MSKVNSSKPDSGPHVPKGKKMTSNSGGSGPVSLASKRRKDSVDVIVDGGFIKKEHRRKVRSQHADQKAAKVQGGSVN